MVMDVLREEPDATAGGGAEPPSSQDAEFYKTEAKKAFQARDKAKEELRKAQEAGLFITPERLEQIRALEESAAKAEEDRKRKAGEFDSLRVELLKKHEETLGAERQRVAAITERLHGTLKEHAFASAGEWFGGSDAKTILTPAIAAAYFGRFVAVEDHNGVDRVVVRNPQGHVIVDAKTGEPAAFSQAIGELIGMLPDKASILRGSGKTGSGSSGGSGGTNQTSDLSELTVRARQGDKEALLALKRHSASLGGIVMGEGARRAS